MLLPHQRASALAQDRDPMLQHSSTDTDGSAAVEQTRPALIPSSNTRSTTPSTPHHRIRRRNRMITSCLECRRRKLKCDRLHPCTNCSKAMRDCLFLAPATDQASQLKMAEIKEKMGMLERDLETKVSNAKKPQHLGHNGERMSSEQVTHTDHGMHRERRSGRLSRNLASDDSDQDADLDVPSDEKDLKPTPLAVVDAAWDNDVDDDMLDLGVKMGRMRVTERLGGYFRPKIAEELDVTLNLSERHSRSPDENVPRISPLPPIGSSQQRNASADPDFFLAPGPTYIAPGSGFYFASQNERSSILDFLPSRPAADRLMAQYHHAVHFIARVVHWPSLKTQYDTFWDSIDDDVEPPASLQAIIFAVMYSAVVSMNESDVTSLFLVSRKTLTAIFQSAAETAFGRANFLRTTKFEILQALVIYLIPMCRGEISRAHSVLVASAIRLAECMGLHRDPQHSYGLGPLESHVRRILWHQLCFLDIRTAEAQGPQPFLRRDDSSPSYPLNVNDTDLLAGNDPPEANGWTDMTFSKIRFECYDMHRVIWIDRKRLEAKEVSLTRVLGNIESFRKAMEAKYLPIIDSRFSMQKAAGLVMNILTLRMHIMVLHVYRDSQSGWLPERIRKTILSTGTQLTEDAVHLDVDPELQPWSWYTGAYQQWHTALLLLLEVVSHPERPEADRIWRSLDHVFETDPVMTTEQKGRIIISELRDRTDRYRANRKMRPPVSMMHRFHSDQMRRQDKWSGPGRGSRLHEKDNAIDPSNNSGRISHRQPPTSNDTTMNFNTTSARFGNSNLPANSDVGNGRGRSSAPLQQSLNITSTDPYPNSAAPTLAQITKAYAEAPSPCAPHPPNGLGWTHDASTTMFAYQAHPNRSNHAPSPGQETTQDTAHTTANSDIPDTLPMRATGLISPNGPTLQLPNGENGGYLCGTMATPTMIPVGPSPIQVQPFVPPNGNGLGNGDSNRNGNGNGNGDGDGNGMMQTQMQSQYFGSSTQASRDPADMSRGIPMMPIDWCEFERIFPADITTTGIIHTPLPPDL